MRQRGDVVCFHEPFGAVWHCGEEEDSSCPENHRYDKRPGLTLRSQLQKIERAAADAPVFVKDFAHHVKPIWGEIVSKVSHSFLIRNPSKALPSLHKQWPDFNLEEAGFEEQRAMFDAVRKMNNDTGNIPTVVDSDDLLADPDQIMRNWCESMDIVHMPEALSWEPGKKSLKTDWYDGEAWHASLEKSTGFSKKNSTVQKISVHDDSELKDKYDQCLPHYQYLHKHRIILK